MKWGRYLLDDWLLPTSAGFLYVLALPPYHHHEFGWLALIPLFFACEHATRGEAFRRGYVAGLVFFAGTVWWVVHVSWPGVVGLIAFLALYFGAGALWLREVFHLVYPVSRGELPDKIGHNLLIGLLSAAGWVTLEWIRGHFPLGGFGWNGLGVTQSAFAPLIQFARFTGVYGVSALMFLINFVFYCTARRFVRNLGTGKAVRRLSWEFYVAMALFAAAMLNGLHEMRAQHAVRGERPLRLALVQADIPQSLKFEDSQRPMILDRYRSLTETATWTQADLVIWPETATPGPIRYDEDSFTLATNAANRARAYLLTGTMDITPYSEPPESFNAAALVRPDGTISDIYHKMHLVPFGEYVPLRKIIPFMKWLTPIPDSFERGTAVKLFNVHGITFGTVICFEDTLPSVYRRVVNAGADFMVNLTNDAWFQDSSAAEIHLANAVFRAVETRRWLVRGTNHGITCVVDPTGVVRARLAPFVPGTLNFVLNLPAEPPTTFYLRHGDVFVAGCAGLWLLGLVAVARRSGMLAAVGLRW
jgi:apolipoprotein N-acyltransferase